MMSMMMISVIMTMIMTTIMKKMPTWASLQVSLVESMRVASTTSPEKEGEAGSSSRLRGWRRTRSLSAERPCRQ